MRIVRALIFFAALVFAAPAFAQATVLQAGPTKQGHVPMYVGTGSQPIVQDSGPAAGGGAGVGLSELGITARGIGTPPYIGQGTGPLGTNVCDYDAPTTNAAGYHYLCWSANALGGAQFVFGAGGAATPQPLLFIVNGVSYTLGNAVSGVVPGTTAIVPSTNGGVLFDNNGILGDSKTLPSGLSATNLNLVTPNISGSGIVIANGAGSPVAFTPPGTGVLTALGTNVGAAGSVVVNGGALGTPSSGVATNLTGVAAGLTAGAANAVPLGGVTGLGTGVATALGNAPNAANGVVAPSNAVGTAGRVLTDQGSGTPPLWQAISGSVINTLCSVSPSTCVSLFGYANPVWWGADPTGTAASDSALLSAAAASSYIVFPSGLFKFAAPDTINYPASVSPGWATTSTTSHTIGTGSQTFTVASGLSITAGQACVAYSQTVSTPVTETGTVTSYSGTSLTCNFTSTSGSGTFAGWNIVQNYLAVGAQYAYAYTIEGAGAGLTELYWPSTAGLTIAETSQVQSFHVANFSYTTGGTAVGDGIALTNSYPFIGTFTPQSSIVGLDCHGHDGHAATDYWSHCVNVGNVQNIYFDKNQYWADGSGMHGVAKFFNNPGAGCFSSPVTCGTIYQGVNESFYFIGIGDDIGANTQTVKETNPVYGQGLNGVVIQANGGNLQDLYIGGITCFTQAACITGATSMPNTSIVGGYMNATTADYAIDILNAEGSILGVSFSPRVASPTGGIKISSASSSALAGMLTIDDNQIAGTVTPIFLNNTTAGQQGQVKVGSNNQWNTGSVLNNYAGNLVFPGGNLQASPNNPTGTTSTTGVMAGLNEVFTPNWSGNLSVAIGGTHGSSAANDGCTTHIRYGTGTPPANGVALTGTALGSNQTSVAGTLLVPFSNVASIVGLSVGTTYWFDLSEAAVTGGTCAMSNMNASILEQ